MDSPPSILAPGLLTGVTVASNDRATTERLHQLGATEGTGVLIHRAPTPTGADGVREALDGAWEAIRATALPPAATGRLIVLIAPPPGDPHRAAARAGLENLARTLSVEWARFAIRPVAILPGERTTPAQIADLVAFLASRAGGYYAGCAFTLR